MTPCSPETMPPSHHPRKSKRWVIDQYYDSFNRFRRDRWVFGDRKSGAYLLKHAWTKIVRAKSDAELQRLQRNPKSGVTGNIVTNLFLYFAVQK